MNAENPKKEAPPEVPEERPLEDPPLPDSYEPDPHDPPEPVKSIRFAEKDRFF